MKIILAGLISLFGVYSQAGNTFGGAPQYTSSGTLAPASNSSYNGNLVNTAGLTYNATYYIDMAQYQGSRASLEVLYGSTTFSSATFTDGQQSTGSITIAQNAGLKGVTVSVGGQNFTFGGNVAVGNTSSNTAVNLNAAMNANVVLAAQIISTAPNNQNIVYSTSIVDGSAFNLTYSSSGYIIGSSSITFSSFTMLGGLTPAWTLANSTFYIPNNGWTLGLQVLFSTGSNTAIGGLSNQTTYYVIPVSASYVELALTSTGAVAGNFIVITSTNAAQTGSFRTYTLTPLGISGTPTFTVKSSNDNINWFTAASTATISVSAYTAPYAILQYDAGFYNYRYLGLVVTPPLTGGFLLKVPTYLKQDGIGTW